MPTPEPLQLEQDLTAVRARDGSVGIFGFFALGFGCIVGSGWVVLLGQWLLEAGPFGAAAGLLAGAGIMVLVALAYGELASRIPIAGADYVYAREAFGRGAGFAVGWFLLLYLLLIVSFEGIVLGWILETILPMLRSAPVYELAGTPVTLDAIAIGIAGAATITALNRAGMGSAVRFQSVVTVVFLVTALVVLILAAVLGGQHSKPAPDLSSTNLLTGTLWVFSTTALFYNGFQAIPQVVENRSKHVSMRAMSVVIAVAIGAACLFYTLVILCTTLAAPWQWTVKQELPASAAVEAALPGLGLTLLCAAAISVIKTWNGLFITSVQTVVALSRDGVLPRVLSKRTPQGIHAAAIWFVAATNVAGILVGRGAIGPLIDMASISMGLVMAACCAGVYRLRMQRGRAPYTMPGGKITLGIATVGPFLMALTAIAGILGRGSFPTEIALMFVWAALGGLFWLFAVRGRAP